jgi:phage shock protein PspC (stress-responsive transcriptional regulator)
MNMSTADELAKLHELFTKGAMTKEEFETAKARVLGGETRATAAINNFRLTEDDKWIAGVCGGIARVTGVDSWIWRLLFVLGLAFGGFTLIIYLLLWIFVPRDGARV